MSNAASSSPAGGLELQQLGGSIAEQQPEKYRASQSASRDQLFQHQTAILTGILLDRSPQVAPRVDLPTVSSVQRGTMERKRDEREMSQRGGGRKTDGQRDSRRQRAFKHKKESSRE
ncbi:DNA ligase, partial [Clarias magur]